MKPEEVRAIRAIRAQHNANCVIFEINKCLYDHFVISAKDVPFAFNHRDSADWNAKDTIEQVICYFTFKGWAVKYDQDKRMFTLSFEPEPKIDPGA